MIRIEPPVQDHLSEAPPPARWGLDADGSMRRVSLTAGIGTLLMIPLAVFGSFVAVQGLLTQAVDHAPPSPRTAIPTT